MRKQMQHTLNILCGQDVEITVRKERDFTLSFEGPENGAMSRLKMFFGRKAKFDFAYDEELNETFIYMHIN